MLKSTIRVIMPIWENDGGTYIYTYVDTIKSKYSLAANLVDIIKIDSIDYGMIFVKGYGKDLINFARNTRNGVITDSRTGIKYMSIISL